MNNQLILNALDAMGLALTNHDHIWTSEERKLYEKAIKELRANDGR
ncbi:MAG: hypothetical protein WC476_08840 [Phycisphaerae bacterium]|jgi:hypothetical protein